MLEINDTNKLNENWELLFLPEGFHFGILKESRTKLTIFHSSGNPITPIDRLLDDRWDKIEKFFKQKSKSLVKGTFYKFVHVFDYVYILQNIKPTGKKIFDWLNSRPLLESTTNKLGLPQNFTFPNKTFQVGESVEDYINEVKLKYPYPLKSVIFQSGNQKLIFRLKKVEQKKSAYWDLIVSDILDWKKSNPFLFSENGKVESFDDYFDLFKVYWGVRGEQYDGFQLEEGFYHSETLDSTININMIPLRHIGFHSRFQNDLGFCRIFKIFVMEINSNRS